MSLREIRIHLYRPTEQLETPIRITREPVCARHIEVAKRVRRVQLHASFSESPRIVRLFFNIGRVLHKSVLKARERSRGKCSGESRVGDRRAFEMSSSNNIVGAVESIHVLQPDMVFTPGV